MIKRKLCETRRHYDLGQFVPYFQPIVTLRTGQLAGFEILARWQHPQHGLVPPDQFIPLAEKEGWIDVLTLELLRKAFEAARFIPEPLTLSINISPVQLRDPSLPGLIRRAAEGTQFPPARLVVEITESALIDNLNHASLIAKELKGMGCKLSLDDFGTGYSSLLHLQGLPFDELKVDRSFVSSMTETRQSRKIVAGVVGLGQSLGLRTVAEGIETREHAETMLWLGCELGQGWYFGRPLPAADLPSVVALHRDRPSAEDSRHWKEITSTNLAGTLSQRISHLQAVYDGAPVALGFVDANLRFVSVNQQLADLNGLSVGGHIGQAVADVVPKDVYALMEPYLQRALKGEAIAGIELTRPQRQPGSGNLTDLSYFEPARDEAGEVIGISMAVVDVTPKRLAEEALGRSEERYRFAMQLSPHIPWIMDSNGHNTEVGPMWEQITGQTPQQTMNFGFKEVFHPDDLAAVMPTIQDSLLTGKPIDIEYRIRTRIGEWLWIRSRGKARRNPEGHIVEWHGSSEDISELRSLQLASQPAEVPGSPAVAAVATPPALQISFPRSIRNDPGDAIASLLASDWSSVQHIFESMANGISISDITRPEMPLIYVNPAFEQLTGYVLEEVRGRNCRFLQNGERAQPGLATLRQALIERRDVRTVLKNFRKDGTPFWNELYLSPIRDRSGNVTRYVGIQNDVTERVELAAQLAHTAQHDMLTGLPNRSLLMDRLAQALSRAKRSGRLVAVLFLDLNDLKVVNDTNGHEAGDLFLKAVGQRLASSIRKYETAARLGGDEFVVVLEDIHNEEDAVQIWHRITAELQQPVWISQASLYPSASIGIALYPQDGQTPAELLRFADRAMYVAKTAFKQNSQATFKAAWLQ